MSIDCERERKKNAKRQQRKDKNTQIKAHINYIYIIWVTADGVQVVFVESLFTIRTSWYGKHQP